MSITSNLSQQSLPTPLLVSDRRSVDTKNVSDIPKASVFVTLGKCMAEVKSVFRLTVKEFAAELGKDEAQVRRQLLGKERPQIEAVFAVERFQGPMAIAMARVAAGVEVDTVIHMRRSA